MFKISLRKVSKNTPSLGINLMQHIQDLSTENDRMLHKEIKEDRIKPMNVSYF